MTLSRGKMPSARDLELMIGQELDTFRRQVDLSKQRTADAIERLAQKDPLVAYVRAVYENNTLKRPADFESDLGKLTRIHHQNIARLGWHRRIVYDAAKEYASRNELFSTGQIVDDIQSAYGSVPDNFYFTVGQILAHAQGITSTGLHLRGNTIWQPEFFDPDHEKYARTLVKWKRKRADDFTAWDLDHDNPRKAGLFIKKQQEALGLRNYYDADGRAEKVDRMMLYGTSTPRFKE